MRYSRIKLSNVCFNAIEGSANTLLLRPTSISVRNLTYSYLIVSLIGDIALQEVMSLNLRRTAATSFKPVLTTRKTSGMYQCCTLVRLEVNLFQYAERE